MTEFRAQMSEVRKSTALGALPFALSIVGAMLFALCASAQAQQPTRVPRVGYLSPLNPAGESTRSEGVRLALRELGYIEGQNIATEYRYAEGKLDRLPELAAELVRLKVDIIVAAGTDRVVRAAKNATTTIPIVMGALGSIRSRRAWLKALPVLAATLQAFQTLAGN
jgi:ABC-type uncharacterized transport system substrate-binding protein